MIVRPRTGRGDVGTEALHDTGFVGFHDIDAAGDPDQKENPDDDFWPARQPPP